MAVEHRIREVIRGRQAEEANSYNPKAVAGRLGPQVRQLPFSAGYDGFAYRGVRYRGFRDHPEWELATRLQIARLALNADSASAGQLRLIENSRELLKLEKEDARLQDEPAFEAALNGLPVRERVDVMAAFIAGRRLHWPLKIKDAAALVKVTEKQLRDWDRAGICSPTRWGSGHYRGYLRAQLVMAALIKQLLGKGYGIERIKADLNSTPQPREAVDLVLLALTVSPRAANRTSTGPRSSMPEKAR